MNNYIDGIPFVKKEPSLYFDGVIPPSFMSRNCSDLYSYYTSYNLSFSKSLTNNYSTTNTTSYAGDYYILFTYESDSKPVSISVVSSKCDSHSAYTQYVTSVATNFSLQSLTDTTGRIYFRLNNSSSYRKKGEYVRYIYLLKIHFNASVKYKAKDCFVCIMLPL